MGKFTEAACWLALLEATDLPRRAVKRAIQQWCVEDARAMREFLQLGVEDIAEHLGLQPTIISQMLTKRAKVATWEQRLAALARQHIKVLLRHEAAYPDLLAERLDPTHQPYYLYYRGNLELLSEPGLLAMGTRSPSREGVTFAKGLGKGAASLGAHVVGGYDEGVERIVQDATLSTNGAAVIVLPLGMERFTGALRAMDDVLKAGRLLVMSPYAPDAELSDVRAQARRSIAAALAGVCVVLEPDLAPDDWSGHDTLCAGHVPIYVWRRGNDDLIQAWARTGAQLVDDLDSALTQAAAWVAPAQDADTAEAIPLDEAEAHGVEPIRFKDANDAIERLSQTGQIPERLRRRLQDIEWDEDL